MGGILSKILGSKVTLRERLEKVDKELRNIQRFQFDTELSQKRWIGRLMIMSSVLYLIAAASFYLFGPTGLTWKGTVPYLLPFLLCPFLIWGLKRLLAWHYKRKIGNNVDTYKELKMERQRLLEDVMEFETFNNAKDILEKYDPNRLLPKYLAEQRLHSPSSPTSTPLTSRQFEDGSDLQEQDTIRRRTFAQNQPQFGRNTPFIRPIAGGPQGQFLRQTMNMPLSRPAIMPSPVSSKSGPVPRPRPLPPPQYMPQGPPRPMFMMPQPPGNPTLHNRSTGWLDKLVDYWVGDGPANRYALICRYCATHNGLATPEDFPYIGYRCVFCRQYNPPRQVKPAAEKLPVNTVVIEEMGEGGIVTSPAPSQRSSVSSPPREVDERSEDGVSSTEDPVTSPGKDASAEAHESVHLDLQKEPGLPKSEPNRAETEEPLAKYHGVEPTTAADNAESIFPGDSEPFEFLEPEGSEVKDRMAEFLSEAAADLEAESLTPTAPQSSVMSHEEVPSLST